MSRVTPPILCETCREGFGVPFRAMSTVEDKIHVDVRCEKCRREWRVEIPAQPIFPGDQTAHSAR